MSRAGWKALPGVFIAGSSLEVFKSRFQDRPERPELFLVWKFIAKWTAAVTTIDSQLISRVNIPTDNNQQGTEISHP